MTASAPPSAHRRRRLYESVFESLTEEILGGQLQAGDKLPMDPVLSARFNVSRTVIREAIQMLAGIGLVDVRHGAGTYVNASSCWDLLNPVLLRLMERTGTVSILLEDLLDIRRMFEAEAVSLAAERATDEDLRRLEALVEEMRDPATSNLAYVDLNLEFHSALVQASHNRILQGLREQLRGVLSVMMNARQRLANEEMRTVSTAMHQMILDSIRERRPDRARAVMLAHVQGAERSLQSGGDSAPADVRVIKSTVRPA